MRPLPLAGAALVAAAALAVPAAAAPPKTLHLYSKSVSMQFYDASGAPITREPMAGDAFAAVSNDYRGTKAHHSKKTVGADHLVCTILPGDGPPALCDGEFALRGGMIYADRFKVTLSADFTNIPVTGGTGRYAKVKGGTVSATGGGEDVVIKLAY